MKTEYIILRFKRLIAFLIVGTATYLQLTSVEMGILDWLIFFFLLLFTLITFHQTVIQFVPNHLAKPKLTLEIHQHEWGKTCSNTLQTILATTDLGTCTVLFGTCITKNGKVVGFLAHFDLWPSTEGLVDIYLSLQQEFDDLEFHNFRCGLLGGYRLSTSSLIRRRLLNLSSTFNKLSRVKLHIKPLAYNSQRPLLEILRYGWSVGYQMDVFKESESEKVGGGVSAYPVLPVFKRKESFTICSPIKETNKSDQERRKL